MIKIDLIDILSELELEVDEWSLRQRPEIVEHNAANKADSRCTRCRQPTQIIFDMAGSLRNDREDSECQH